MAATVHTDPVFEAPGPGEWQLDRSHYTGGTTPIMQWLMSEAVEEAFRKQWPDFGIPAETLQVRFVHGFSYTRMRPLISPDKAASKLPPLAVLKAATRTHPEFRRRNKAAAKMLAESPSPAAIAEWRERTRPRLIAQNLALQDVDLSELDDILLAGHIDLLLNNLRWSFEEHFRLHTYDLGPIAKLLHMGLDWGLEPGDLVAALAGASPSTGEPLAELAEIRALIEESGHTPTSLQDIRDCSPAAAHKLDAYLRRRGAVLYAGYDIDSPTLQEAPHVVLATVMNPAGARAFDHAAHDKKVESLRAQVPTSDLETFDGLLADAREAMDMRDDNGPITVEWPAGLLRLAMLEAGKRLEASGSLHEADHIFEFDQNEVLAAIRGTTTLSADTVAARATERKHQRTLTPPPSLGTPEIAPPISVLPKALATAVGMVETALSQMGMTDEGNTDQDARMSGVGIGTEAVVGTACVALDAEEAFETLTAGDILVTRTTSPAYNMVLTMVGGLVTAEGGPMSHAAVLSRELAIPAVIGAADALSAISTGDQIEVDPAAGTVRIV